MKIIKPSCELVWITPNAEKMIERAGRVCYKSEELITEESSAKFIENIVKRGHEAVLEHATASLLFICDRGVTHELVRHRLVAYCQESTRYCNYSKDKFNNELTFIEPCFYYLDEELNLPENKNHLARLQWYNAMLFAEETYKKMTEYGATPQEARSVLPNSLKTEIVCTTNLREWRHILKLRTSKFAHPQIIEVMNIAKDILKKECSNVFGDIE
jgi:thymidylate synthase (FAD)